jgi:hypothetical protein
MAGKIVICPQCGYEQVDMGHFVACEECSYAPMPTHEESDLDLDEPEPSFFNGVAPRKSAA